MNNCSVFRRCGPAFVALLFMTQLVLLTYVLPRAYALSQADTDALRYGWENWVADPVCTGSTSDVPLSGNDNAQKAFNFFVQKGLTKEQSAGIVGNLMAESNINPSIQQNKSKQTTPIPNVGFGIAQWTDPGRQAGLVALAKSKNVSVTDLGLQLEYEWQELTTTYKSVYSELKTITDARAAAVMFMIKFESPKEKSPTGPNAKLRGDNAVEVLSTYGGGATANSNSTNTVSGCVVGQGAVAGNMVQTALGYAWPDRGHGFNQADAKPSYQTDMPKFNGSTGFFPFSDCGVFVSTVVIASGVDPNYPKRGTTQQMAYMAAHPAMYQEINGVTNTSQLQPGDILVNTVHTMLFVGKQPQGYDTVDASLHTRPGNGHVPERSGFDTGFRVFRVINAKGDSKGQ